MRENRRGKRWFAVLAVASLALLILAAHQSALADEGLIEEGWNIEEIEFELPEPVPGRRLYMERLEVSGDRARVTLRAATGLEVLALAFGGEDGRPLRMWWPATLDRGREQRLQPPPIRRVALPRLLMGGLAGPGRGHLPGGPSNCRTRFRHSRAICAT